jgi:DNA-binding beta-propeller fold protein YncE
VGALHFPTAAVASRDGRWLYVANSNFNLEYSGALVQAFDLEAIRVRARARRADPAASDHEDDESTFLNRTIGGSVRVGSYVTSMVADPEGDRLYLTSRAAGCVAWIDLVNGQLSCDQAEAGGLCDQTGMQASHCVGVNPTGPRMLRLPPNPTSVSVFDGPGGLRYLAVTHHEDTRSRVSLLVDPGAGGPIMSHFAGEFSAHLWTQFRLNDPNGHWLVFSRDEPAMGHVRLFADGNNSFVFRGTPSLPSTVPSNLGIFHVVADRCNPNRAYAAARSRRGTTSALAGDNLLALDVSNPDDPRVVDQLAMPLGPSQVLEVPRGPSCDDGSDLYVVLYDSRKLYVVDTQEWRELAEVRTQVGPVALVADPHVTEPDSSFLYVINFSSMCIEVLDARTRTVLFTVGEPIRPKELS